ncbi:hypothetical protein AAFF_G00294140 [Aldrovandia affinis]|uniref:Uncharacterized protein n=1 Tax=Aldrovandia affinis TaxID=143900 RepID=A0AAD7W1U8_9TELE|nr:hypothetical protein AAFF_G00294140 [Aldrovandia affinis]
MPQSPRVPGYLTDGSSSTNPEDAGPAVTNAARRKSFTALGHSHRSPLAPPAHKSPSMPACLRDRGPGTRTQGAEIVQRRWKSKFECDRSSSSSPPAAMLDRRQDRVLPEPLVDRLYAATRYSDRGRGVLLRFYGNCHNAAEQTFGLGGTGISGVNTGVSLCEHCCFTK